MNTGFPVQKVAILADPRDEAKRRVIQHALGQLVPYLTRAGIASEVFLDMPVGAIAPAGDTSLFLVLGGDGTMIHFAYRLSHHGIPFYGLNYGNVGFMMNNPQLGLEKRVQQLREGSFILWQFPLLTVEATDFNGRVHRGVGLNDIYLQRMTPQSCKLNLIINGESLPVNPLLCDGIIVATPLGSTAYSYNVTGSMVAINAPVIVVTPVAAARSCPLSCLMLPLDTDIQFDLLEPEKRRVQVVSDGMSHGDITRARVRVLPGKLSLGFDPGYSGNLPMRFIQKACGA